jgi:hypothetical protein
MWLLVVTAVAVWPLVAAGGQEDLYMEHMYSHYLQQEARYHGHHQALFTFYFTFHVCTGQNHIQYMNQQYFMFPL